MTGAARATCATDARPPDRRGRDGERRDRWGRSSNAASPAPAAIPGKHGGPGWRTASVFVSVPDHPGELARLFADAGDIGVNIEDVRIDHDPGPRYGPGGAGGRRGPAAEQLRESLEARDGQPTGRLGARDPLGESSGVGAGSRLALRQHVVVAMDGPSGSGKSSTSRGVAARLGLRYLDTGAMFRAMTWWMLDTASTSTTPPRSPHGAPSRLVVRHRPGAPHDHRRRRRRRRPRSATHEVTSAVSAVSAVPEVRARLLDLQRATIIGDGRHRRRGPRHRLRGGPDAEVKVYLTADAGGARRPPGRRGGRRRRHRHRGRPARPRPDRLGPRRPRRS